MLDMMEARRDGSCTPLLNREAAVIHYEPHGSCQGDADNLCTKAVETSTDCSIVYYVLPKQLRVDRRGQ